MSSHYRRSGDDLAYGEDYSSPQRWDRARFDRARRGGSRDVDIDFRETDRYNGPRGSGYREVDVDERFSRGGPPRSRYEDDRREFVIRERETDGREIAPYKSRYDRELPPRGYARRQQSPGGYDDRRYHDDDRDVNISVHVDNNDRHYPPPRERPYYDDDRYRGRYEDDVRVRREVEREIWRPSRDSYEEREEFYEHDSEHNYRERRGKTKMPKRLVHKRAIVELGFPFAEEDDFYFVQVPLDQGQIDEVLRISDRFFKEEVEFSQKTETKYIEAPPAPRVAEPGVTETTTTTTTTIIENPTDEEIAELSRAQENNDNNDGDGNGDDNVNINVENASVATAHGTTKAGKGNEETTSFHESFHEHESNKGGSEDIDERKSAHGSSTSHGRHLSVHDSSHEHRSRSRHDGHHHRGRSKSHHRRSKSGVRRVYDDDYVEESATIGLGPLGSLQIRDRSRRRSTAGRDREIKAEIRDLEDEKRALRDRHHHHHHHHKDRDTNFEEVVRVDRHRDRSSSSDSTSRATRDDVVRVEKDRSGRLNLVRSAR